MVTWRQLQAEDKDVTMLVCGDNQVTLRPQVVRPSGAPAPDILEAFRQRIPCLLTTSPNNASWRPSIWPSPQSKRSSQALGRSSYR